MILKKLNIILLFFLVGNLFSLSNSEINLAIKQYLSQNGMQQDFSINKKIKLPNCRENIEFKKKYDSFKTLEIICPQDNPWTYNIRIKIQNDKKKLKKKENLKIERLI